MKPPDPAFFSASELFDTCSKLLHTANTYLSSSPSSHTRAWISFHYCRCASRGNFYLRFRYPCRILFFFLFPFSSPWSLLRAERNPNLEMSEFLGYGSNRAGCPDQLTDSDILTDLVFRSSLRATSGKPHQPSDRACLGSLIARDSYVGVLHEINSEESTVSLENVRSFGTEGRKGRPEEEIAPSDQVYEYIIFRGSDVKDLRIEETPGVKENAPPPMPEDPAIVGVSLAPAQHFPNLAFMMKYCGCKPLSSCRKSAKTMSKFSVAFLLIPRLPSISFLLQS